MKKYMAMVISLLLLAGMTAVAAAEPFYLEAAGVTIEVPEGMTATDGSDEEGEIYSLFITVDERDDLIYWYTLSHMEELAGKDLADLSEEEAQEMGMGIALAIEEPEFELTTLDEVDYLIVVDGLGAELHYISLQDGWITDVGVGRLDGTLTDEEIDLCAELLASITYDEE